MVIDSKVVPAVRSFTFDLFDALTGKSRVSPPEVHPPAQFVQFPELLHAPEDAPVH